VLIRTAPEADEVEAFVRLPGGEPALIDTGHNHVRVEVAAISGEAARAGAARLRRALAAEPPAPERVPVAFWMRGEWGGDVRHREIDAPRFADIADNYAAAVRDALERLIVLRAPERGRLILWRGEPGTGSRTRSARSPERGRHGARRISSWIRTSCSVAAAPTSSTCSPGSTGTRIAGGC
jgi:hypothetical protein